MPSKRRQQYPQAALQSDYDTETAGPVNTEQAIPDRTIEELNLLVLKRYVPTLQRIASIAPFAVVYIFSPETQQWEKSGVEGTLFVCQLSGAQHPRYNVVILNRKSLDNFITELVSADDVEITNEYVILQVLGEDGTPQIYGLWIFSEEGQSPSTKDLVALAIQECAVRAQQGEEQAQDEGYGGQAEDYAYEMEDTAIHAPAVHAPREAQAQQPSHQAGQPIDLLQLFGKPQVQSHARETPAPAPGVVPTRTVSQQPMFASTPDTDFFRSSKSPALQQPTNPPNPAVSQQNALLDLFKNAKRG